MRAEVEGMTGGEGREKVRWEVRGEERIVT